LDELLHREPRALERNEQPDGERIVVQIPHPLAETAHVTLRREGLAESAAILVIDQQDAQSRHSIEVKCQVYARLIWNSILGSVEPLSPNASRIVAVVVEPLLPGRCEEIRLQFSRVGPAFA